MLVLLRLLSVVVILCLSSINSRGQSRHVLSDPQRVYRLDSTVEVFLDHSRSLSFDNIISQNDGVKFQKANGNLTFGYIKANIWLKVQVRTDLPDAGWYLELPAPYLEYVDFYQMKDSAWSHSQSGYYRPQRVREISHTGHVVPLDFSNGVASVIIQIAGDSPNTFTVLAMKKEKFTSRTRVQDFGYGIFFGILIVMFFYNLFIYFGLRQTNYLIYILTIIFTFLIFSSASGYGSMFLWPDHPRMNYYAGRLALPFQVMAVTWFAIRFLHVREYSRVMYYLLLGLIPAAIIATILIETKVLFSAGNHLISIATIFYMTAGIFCRIRGNVTANYFIAAWSVYLIGGLLLTLRNSGFLPYSFLTTHFVEIGAGLETVIIAFALAATYRRLRIQKEAAQNLALRLQQETTEKLEVKVKERTEQLLKVNDNLRETLETNRVQTQIIEEKNAELDAFFYRVAHDLKGPISSLRGLVFLARIDVQDDTARGYIDKQYQQIERLDLIINGLIKLTNLNQSNLEKSTIDFHKLVDDCLVSLQAHPRFNSIQFRKEIGEGLDFQSEWTLINAILQNLIENAIKYSVERDPFVRIGIQREDSVLILEVEDNGVGIPNEHQSKIFEMFYRGTAHANGSGLGLYILKRSVDRLKGVIDIKSVERNGSTFTVKLPY
jgi:two-component system, sensor histidine kinase LadS